MSVLSYVRRLGRDGMIYGSASVLNAGIGFVLMMVVTRLVSPAGYGTIEIFKAVNQFLAQLIEVGMDAAHSFFFYRTETDGPRSRRSLTSALLQFRVGWGLIAVLITAIVVPLWIARGSDIAPARAVTYFVLAAAWCWAMEVTLVPLTHLRMSERPAAYGTFTVTHMLLAGALVTGGVLWLPDPVLGYLGGFAAASLVVLLVLLFLCRSEFVWLPIQRHWWKELARFGFPFLPAAFLFFALQTADRWFIARLLGRSELGVYAVGAQFASIAGALVTTFVTAWEPLAMSKFESEDGPLFFRSVSRIYLAGFSALAIAVTLLLPWILQWSAAPVYAGALPIARALIWVPIFQGFFYIASPGIWKHQKTLWVPVLILLVLVLDVAANYYAVGRYGIVGAALTTSVSFGILGFAGLILGERLWKVRHSIPVLILELVIGIGVCCAIGALEAGHVPFWLRAAVAAAGMGLLARIARKSS